jgi:hypothetical protein
VTRPADGSYVATLRVSTDGGCDDVSRALGVDPDECHEKGTPLSPRSARRTVRERALWRLRSRSASGEPLDAHLRDLLGRVAGDAVRALSAGGDDVELFCFVDVPETTLSAAVLGEVAAVSASLVLDVYPPESGGAGKSTWVTFRAGTGDVLGSGLPPGEPLAAHVAALSGRHPLGADGYWDVGYASDNGQGSIELGPELLGRLAAVGAPVTVRLVATQPG